MIVRTFSVHRPRFPVPLWAVVTALVMWGLVAALGGGVASVTHGQDREMYAAVTARVADGENYYRVLADELPARGYAVRPVFNWRLPTLTHLNAALGSLAWSRALLMLFGLISIAVWVIVVSRRSPAAAIAAALVMLPSAAPLTVSGAPFFHEVWAGVLISGSLGFWAMGRVTSSVLVGAAALFIRELAIVFVGVMCVLAIVERRFGEAKRWGVAIAAFVVFWLWHAWQAWQVMPADGLTNSWTSLGGWPFVLVAAQSHALLMTLPAPVAACVVPIAWAGAFYWKGATGRRLAVVLSAFFCAFAIAGRPDNWYWGLMFTPLLTVAPFGFFAERSSSRTAAATRPEIR
jgi:hypothetical protein